ncbi:DUF6663 family protein [Halococcus saccharolyticus]|uniref:Uncharacterized protein n=1 Tax=Halococcus saccharolyticus DSM 5350 TaxID=1227455 RepID=M0MI16_9EURY|nr:DUF6663 family protein [Halococcus saccharolyticus]EMA44055.1 hypothetical protein C449_11033 [Halococcus saccharolyticus DSM 5350]
MQPTTAGTYRVLDSTRGPDELLLLDVESQDPTYVTTVGYEGDLGEAVAELEPGNRIDATLSWDDGAPRFADLAIDTRTTIEFADGATDIFEVARETWNEARREGAAMNSRVTQDTDGEENGVVYTFAEQAGQRDLYGEFRDGVTPLEPLIDRLGEGSEPPYAAFVIRPAEHPFVLVALALDRDALFAETIRDTYFS